MENGENNEPSSEDFKQQVQALAETLLSDLRTFKQRAYEESDTTSRERADVLAEKAEGILTSLNAAAEDADLMYLFVRNRRWRKNQAVQHTNTRLAELETVEAKWKEALDVMQDMREEISRRTRGR